MGKEVLDVITVKHFKFFVSLFGGVTTSRVYFFPGLRKTFRGNIRDSRNITLLKDIKGKHLTPCTITVTPYDTLPYQNVQQSKCLYTLRSWEKTVTHLL